MISVLIAGVLAAALAGCTTDESATPTATPQQASAYAETSMWLCGPDASPDRCLDTDLTATRFLRSGATESVAHVEAADPPADCFYVYPTVRFEPECGNATDFSSLESEAFAVQNQAARFSAVCRVIAPVYRQRVRCPPIDREGVVAASEIDDVAYGDVRDAFAHYLQQHNAGRPFFLIGHSQGADLLARLVTTEIDADPKLQRRMAAAFLIGGDIFVPHGETTGGTLGDVPLCDTDDQTGCAIAYRSFAASRPPEIDPATNPPRLDMACTNPASLAGGRATLSGSFLPNPSAWKHPLFDLRAMALPSAQEASTPHLLFEDSWTAECRKDGLGQSYLSIGSEGRESWVNFDSPFFNPAAFGTHPLDIQFALGDLMRLVTAKTSAMEQRRPPR